MKENIIYSISLKFSRRAAFLRPYLESLRFDLKKAGIMLSFENYLGFVLFTTVLGLLLSSTVSLTLLLLYRLPLVHSLLFFLGASLLGATLGFSASYFYPSVRVGSRRRQLEGELPHYIGFMATLSIAGLTPYEIFEKIASERSKRVIVEEAKLIVRDVKLLGLDILKALENARERSPSTNFSELLEGIISTTKVGGDLGMYLSNYTSAVLSERSTSFKMFTETAGMLAEIYTMLLIVFPMILVIMFSVMSIISGELAGFAIFSLMYLLTYVIVPAFGTTLLLLLDSMMPKV